jgi:protein-disulfide isomerase
MSKQFLAVVAAIIIVFVGIFVISNHKSGSSGNNISATKPTNHVEGQGKDGVTLVEYGDYQCPYCGEAYQTIKAIQQEYNQQITFQFRNFPLTSLHPNAFAGARAAEAANLQGKFWDMHDLLYDQNVTYYGSNETDSTWVNASNPLPDFDSYAKQLGLNVSEFNTDYASTKVDDVINADLSAGNKLGITGTPTFYLDGKQLSVTSYSLKTFQGYINAAIKQKTSKSTS